MARPTSSKSRGPFAPTIAKAAKRQTGRTTTEQTPLAVRTSGLKLDPAERERIAARVGSKLGKFALHIERATVRLEDVNGPKGGPDKRCRIKVTLSGRPSLLVEKEGETVQAAFDVAIDAMQRVLRKALQQAEMSAPKPARKARAAREAAAPAPAAPVRASKKTAAGSRTSRGDASRPVVKKAPAAARRKRASVKR